HPVLLDVLTQAEAQHLLARRLGPRRTAAEPEAVAEIIARCDRLPLALAVVAARAAIRPGFPLAGFAAELRESSGLDALSGRDARADLRSVFSWSTNALSRPAARLFRLLAGHPGPDISTASAAGLAALSLSEVRALLAELADAYLVVEHTAGRYTCHDLLRAHATELAQTHDTEQDRRSATLRVLDHYLHTGRTAAALFNPQRVEPPFPPAEPGVGPEPVPDYAAASTWFTAEHRSLLAATDHAARTGHHRHAAHLAWVVSGFLDRCGHWEDWIRCQRTALTASRHLRDRGLQADAHRNLGRAHARLGREDEAYDHYNAALELYRRIDDPGGQARTHTNLALLLEQTQNHTEALSHALQSLSIHRSLKDDGVGHANALNTVGWCYALVGDYRQTLVHCQEAIVLHRRINDRDGEAATWDTLGYAHHHLGNHRQATICYQAAIRLYRELGDRYYESLSLIHLGDLHNGSGEPGTARENWQRAMHILTDLNHPAATDVQARLQGAVEATPSTTTR
ncbi:MAG: tetratricopeptide repeat protein, partial [Saccharothrix sp.]|nr:tetratricopeptide repeat protein [Saccharothrix sp.]